MLRIVITVFSWDNALSAHCCLLSSSWAFSEKVVGKKKFLFYFFLWHNLVQFWKRCPSSLCGPIFHYRNLIPSYFTHEFPLVLPADDMWANTGLYSRSGPWLPIHQPFILRKWNKVTRGNWLPAGSKCSPAALHSHPPTCTHSFSLVTPLLVPVLVYWVSRSISSAPRWCQRCIAAEHRNGWTRNTHTSPWPVSVATLSRISLATTRTCIWTLMVIHQTTVFSLQYLSTQWCRWWLYWETGVIYEKVLHSIVQDMEHGVASIKNWRSTNDVGAFNYY